MKIVILTLYLFETKSDSTNAVYYLSNEFKFNEHFVQVITPDSDQFIFNYLLKYLLNRWLILYSLAIDL